MGVEVEEEVEQKDRGEELAISLGPSPFSKNAVWERDWLAMFNTAAQYFLPKNVPNKVLHVT